MSCSCARVHTRQAFWRTSEHFKHRLPSSCRHVQLYWHGELESGYWLLQRAVMRHSNCEGDMPADDKLSVYVVQLAAGVGSTESIQTLYKHLTAMR